MITDINSEDRLVQETFASHPHDKHGWDSVYAWNDETFGPGGTLGCYNMQEGALSRGFGGLARYGTLQLPSLNVQNRSLNDSRKLLLPRLMSGEIVV